MRVGRFVSSCVGEFFMKVVCAKYKKGGYLDIFKEYDCTWKHDNIENLRSK